MSKMTEDDKKLVADVVEKVSRKIMALIEGDFIHEFEIELEVSGEKYELILKKKKQ